MTRLEGARECGGADLPNDAPSTPSLGVGGIEGARLVRKSEHRGLEDLEETRAAVQRLHVCAMSNVWQSRVVRCRLVPGSSKARNVGGKGSDKALYVCLCRSHTSMLCDAM